MQERTDTRALADVALRADIMALVFTTVPSSIQVWSDSANLCATATRFLNLLNKPGFFSIAPSSPPSLPRFASRVSPRFPLCSTFPNLRSVLGARRREQTQRRMISFVLRVTRLDRIYSLQVHARGRLMIANTAVQVFTPRTLLFSPNYPVCAC